MGQRVESMDRSTKLKNMEIKTRLEVAGMDGAVPPQRAVPPAVAAPRDGASFTDFTHLETALKNLPDSRPEAVGRAKQLITDVEYPSPELIAKLANLLASNVGSPPK
jgi:hypothetical protein